MSIGAKSLELLVICLDLFRESIVGEGTELSVMLDLVLEIGELLDNLLALR